MTRFTSFTNEAGEPSDRFFKCQSAKHSVFSGAAAPAAAAAVHSVLAAETPTRPTLTPT